MWKLSQCQLKGLKYVLVPLVWKKVLLPQLEVLLPHQQDALCNSFGHGETHCKEYSCKRSKGNASKQHMGIEGTDSDLN